jgi:hypothetical protein
MSSSVDTCFLPFGAQVDVKDVFFQHRLDTSEINTLTDLMELPTVELLIWAMCATEQILSDTLVRCLSVTLATW